MYLWCTRHAPFIDLALEDRRPAFGLCCRRLAQSEQAAYSNAVRRLSMMASMPLAAGMGGSAQDPDPAGSVLGRGQHVGLRTVQQAGGLQVQRQDRLGLGAQELRPARAGAPGRRVDAMPVQGLPDRRRRHGHTEPGQLAGDPPVPRCSCQPPCAVPGGRHGDGSVVVLASSVLAWRPSDGGRCRGASARSCRGCRGTPGRPVSVMFGYGRDHCWLEPSVQAQIWAWVPEPPKPVSSRHLPDCGFRYSPLDWCCQTCAPVPLHG